MAKATAKKSVRPAVAKQSPAGLVLTVPAMKKGEIYAGIILNDFPNASGQHHLILLPGDVSMKWADATAWAKKQGGDLPTRKEQALLFANAAEAFEQRYYWSSEVHAGGADCAWVQYFGDGYQYLVRKDLEYRARAVRRVAI